MDKDKENKPFSHPRWNDTILPHVICKSECTPEQYERIHKRLKENLEKGIIKQEAYDYFENN